jgi:hypothetical protein
MKKLTIYLKNDDLETLERISREELRKPTAQALLIIREELKRWRFMDQIEKSSGQGTSNESS